MSKVKKHENFMKLSKKILVTGGCGFIGSALVRLILNKTKHRVMNIDKLTYAGNFISAGEMPSYSKYIFRKIDICNSKKIKKKLYH